MARISFGDEVLKDGQPALVRNCIGESWRLGTFKAKVLDDHGETVYIVEEQGKAGCSGWKLCIPYNKSLDGKDALP